MIFLVTSLSENAVGNLGLNHSYWNMCKLLGYLWRVRQVFVVAQALVVPVAAPSPSLASQDVGFLLILDAAFVTSSPLHSFLFFSRLEKNPTTRRIHKSYVRILHVQAPHVVS
jgi:hypothetical protein